MSWSNADDASADEQVDDVVNATEAKPSFNTNTWHSVRLALTKPLLRFTRAVRNRAAGHKQVYQTAGLNRVTRANVGHQLRIRENRLFAAAETNDLELLEHCIQRITSRQQRPRRQTMVATQLPAMPSAKAVGLLHDNPCRDFDFEDRTELGGTAFHIALQNNNVGVANRLLAAYPDYVNMPYIGKLNAGQHPLHIAVVNRNLELVKQLVARGADVDTPRCTGEFFNPSSKHCQVYWGEHVLSFAVCLYQKDIVEYLLQNGADVEVQDERGNTLLHMLVLQRDKRAALSMFKYLVDELEVGASMEDVSNKAGLTPLKLAAKEANEMFVKELLHRRRQVHWTYGPITSCVYSLKDIDTYGDSTSVLELLAQNVKPESFHLLKLSPLKELLDAKWRQFGFLYFIMWFIVYLLNTIILTVVVAFRPVYCPMDLSQLRNTTGDNGTVLSIFLNFVAQASDGNIDEELQSSEYFADVSSCNLQCFPLRKRRIFAAGSASAYHTSGDYVRLFGEVLVLLGALVSLGYEIPDLYRKGYRKYFYNVGSGSFQALSWIYAFFIILSLILRLAENDNEEITLAIAVLLGWSYTLFFARGFAFLGPYISMIQTILQTDTLRFLIIFVVGIVSFSGVFHAMFNEARPLPPGQLHSYGDTFIYLFRLAIGITEILGFRPTPASAFTIIFFFIYVILGFLLLIQLLIAMMNATHQKVEQQREGVWEKQLASLILLLERRLPQRLTIRTGIPGKQYLLVDDADDDTWFIRVQEHGELKKISRVEETSYTKRRRQAIRRKGPRRRSGPGNKDPGGGATVLVNPAPADNSPEHASKELVPENHGNGIIEMV